MKVADNKYSLYNFFKRKLDFYAPLYYGDYKDYIGNITPSAEGTINKDIGLTKKETPLFNNSGLFYGSGIFGEVQSFTLMFWVKMINYVTYPNLIVYGFIHDTGSVIAINGFEVFVSPYEKRFSFGVSNSYFYDFYPSNFKFGKFNFFAVIRNNENNKSLIMISNDKVKDFYNTQDLFYSLNYYSPFSVSCYFYTIYYRYSDSFKIFVSGNHLFSEIGFVKKALHPKEVLEYYKKASRGKNLTDYNDYYSQYNFDRRSYANRYLLT